MRINQYIFNMILSVDMYSICGTIHLLDKNKEEIEMEYEVTVQDIGSYLKESFERSCKDLKIEDLSIENKNWVEGRVSTLNELLAMYFKG